MIGSKDQPESKVGVLVSGGVESAAMLVRAAEQFDQVVPIYIAHGWVWEKTERKYLQRFLATLDPACVQSLVVLDAPLESLYGKHWATGTDDVPEFGAPNESVCLPGRNVLLLNLAGIYCAQHGIPEVWLGVLAGNVFADARTEFVSAAEQALQLALQVPVKFVTPFRAFNKTDIIQQNAAIDWTATITCIAPVGEQHCGDCQKCGERQKGFLTAGVKDPTVYLKPATLEP